jgi:hypothetical protein
MMGTGSLNQPEKPDPNRRIGAWSIVSLSLAGLAIVWFLLPNLALPRSVAGPAEAAGMLVAMLACYFLAGLCTALGAASGWLGVRRAPGRLAWAALTVNEALSILGVVLATLGISHNSGQFVPAVIVILLGAFITSLILGKGVAARRLSVVLGGSLVLVVIAFLLRIW